MSRDYSDGGTIDIEGPDGFRMIPDTILLDLDLLHVDVRLYGLLLWHGRSGNGTYPGRRKLAEELGAKSVRTIDNSLQRLQAKGYLTIIPQYNEDGSQDRNRYRLHFKPLPPEKRQIRQKPDEDPSASSQAEGGRNELHGGSPEGGEQLIAPGGGATDCTPGGATDCATPVQPVARHKGKEPKRKEVQEKEEQPLPAVGDYSTVGSSALAAVPAGKPKLSVVPDPEPAPEVPASAPVSAGTVGDVYRAFAALMPPEVSARVSKRSGDIARIIREELAHRSPAELVERITRRWETWRYRIEDIRDPVGVAQTLIRLRLPGRQCPDLRCEDGLQLDLDQPCTACAETGGKPAAAQRAEPAPAPPRARISTEVPLGTGTPTPPPSDEVLRSGHPDMPSGWTTEDAWDATERGAAAARTALRSLRAHRRPGGGQSTAQTIKDSEESPASTSS